MHRPSLLTRRLLPLYIATFFQNIVFWYATEKLFMVGIGFNTASIGLMVAIMSIVMLAVETPSGVLADRWSRKGVMMIGCISLMISGVVGAFSFNEPVYIISTIFWGVYAALYSGTYDAVIYDATIEEHGNKDKFEMYLGKFRAVEGAAAVIGALSGGIIASTLSMRDNYIFSIPFIFAALIFLWKFREPQLHKMELSEPIFKHIKQTFTAVLKNRMLLPIVVAIIGFTVLQETLFEFSQLWFLAVSAPILLYGLFSAILFSSWTVGGLLASRSTSRRSGVILIILVLATFIILASVRSYISIIIAQFIAAVCLIALIVVLTKKMHDEFPSRLRAGSSSVVSTLGRTILIPGSILLTLMANDSSIFTATYTLIALAAIASFAFLKIRKG